MSANNLNQKIRKFLNKVQAINEDDKDFFVINGVKK